MVQLGYIDYIYLNLTNSVFSLSRSLLNLRFGSFFYAYEAVFFLLFSFKLSLFTHPFWRKKLQFIYNHVKRNRNKQFYC